MELKLICNLLGLDLDDATEDFVFRDYRLSTNEIIVLQHFSTAELVGQIGEAFAGSMFIHPFFYCFRRDPSLSLSLPQLQKVITDDMDWINAFISYLWLIKDNSVNPNVFLSYDAQNHRATTSEVSHHNSTAQGEFTNTAFTKEELIETVKFMEANSEKSTITYLPEKEFETKGLEFRPTRKNYVNYNTTNRVERAAGFVASARRTSNLVTKISLYIPALESLFSTSPVEITHQVCERIAVYLSTELERWETYTTLKEAYNFRSRYFHGDILPNKYKQQDQQRELAVKIDNIARLIMRKVYLYDFDKFLYNPNNQKQSENFHTRLIKMVLYGTDLEPQQVDVEL